MVLLVKSVTFGDSIAVFPQSPLSYQSRMHPVLRYPMASISLRYWGQIHGLRGQRIGLWSILPETHDFVAPQDSRWFLGKCPAFFFIFFATKSCKTKLPGFRLEKNTGVDKCPFLGTSDITFIDLLHNSIPNSWVMFILDISQPLKNSLFFTIHSPFTALCPVAETVSH